MLSKKISLFFCSFISIMLITNLFAFPLSAESNFLDYKNAYNDIDFNKPIKEVKGGELIYLIARQNGIKLTNSIPADLFSQLEKDYSSFQSINPILSTLSDLYGTFYSLISDVTKSLLYIPKNVYNSILNFLRREVVVFGLNSQNAFVLSPVVKNYDLNTSNFLNLYKSIFTGTPSSYKIMGNYSLIYGNIDKVNNKVNSSGGYSYHFDVPVYQFCRFLYSNQWQYYYVSLKPFNGYRLYKLIDSNGHTTEYKTNIKSKTTIKYYGVTLYVYSEGLGAEHPMGSVETNQLFSSSGASTSKDYEMMCYLFSIYKFNNTSININYYNNTLSQDSTSDVIITNIYITNNNITINNNGTDSNVDDDVTDSDVSNPKPPLYEPISVTTTLNDIDTINKYHNDMELQTNDFLIQFNENLNKIDTNCYSLTSCAINGLKSVGNAVNDITGYTEKGMNSDIVLLICLFLLLGILFTIL